MSNIEKIQQMDVVELANFLVTFNIDNIIKDVNKIAKSKHEEPECFNETVNECDFYEGITQYWLENKNILEGE